MRAQNNRRIQALLVATAILWPIAALSAAQVPPSAPVTVVNTPANPIPVTGNIGLTGNANVTVTNTLLSVETLNDVLSTPYMVSRSGAFVPTAFPSESVDFDVPDGKRLIIESMTVRVALEAAGNAVIQFSARPGAFGELSLQSQGAVADPDTNFWLTGTHSIKLRIDALAGRTDELVVSLRRPAVLRGTWNVLVSGYLVPLP